MKKKIFLLLFLFLSFFISAQEEVRITIKDGLQMIPVAMPDSYGIDGTLPQDPVVKEIWDTIWEDLSFSRVFTMIPKERYAYIPKVDPSNINFKDWASIGAKVLILTGVSKKENKLIFTIQVYDIKGKQILGRNFGGSVDLARVIAHKASDEIMKSFGEVPLFSSKIAFTSSRDGSSEIYFMDYDGKRIKRVTNNGCIDILPSWSGNNEQLLYTSYRKGSPDLYSFHLYSGKTELLATGRANYSADWSPQEDKIAFTSTRDGNAEIYIRDMLSGKLTRLTFNKVIDVSPSWSPNGRELAFISERSGTAQVYIMDKEGTNVRRITNEGTRHDSPEWSPDGSRIAYTLMLSGAIDVYIYNLQSNSITKITEESGRNENPTWSPDGRHLAFASNRLGSYNIYLVDYDGANLKRITSKGNNKMPNWQKSVK